MFAYTAHHFILKTFSIEVKCNYSAFMLLLLDPWVDPFVFVHNYFSFFPTPYEGQDDL